MSIPRDVLFHRYFQRPEISPTDRQAYKGKKDLDTLHPSFRPLLARIQEVLNEALSNEKKNVPEHVSHPPFYFDYVDSTVANALAFRFEGHSFIGITMPLVEMLWETCVRLSMSDVVGSLLLAVPVKPEHYEALHAVLFYTQLTFVVTHEFTHHVHGHVLKSALDSTFSNEIVDCHDHGNLGAQALEIDADGYATYHVLAHLIEGERRSQAVGLLKREQENARVQDEALFASFVVAIGAFLFVRRPTAINSSRIYDLTHPPQAARMNWIMHNAINWCRQNRPDLERWMTKEKFQILMGATATATWGMNGGNDWRAQTIFLQSVDGAEYIRKLDLAVKTHIRSL